MKRRLIIDRPVVDVYAEPSPVSERINQLLFNEAVTALGSEGDFLRVRGPDGYVGWIRGEHAFPATPFRPTHLVDVPVASLLDERAGCFAGKLSYGTRISIIDRDESFGRIDFRGKPAWISIGCVRRQVVRRLQWPTLRKYLDTLVGTPYLWGGRSGFGLDCSGLVQLVYDSCGYSLPRDSADQRRRGRNVSITNLRPGDLIFSPGHVCVYYGSGRIIHSSARAGGVYVEDMLTDAPDGRVDIRCRIEAIKRII